MNYKEDKPLKINPEEPEGVSNRFYFDLRSCQNLVHDYLNGEVKKVIHAKWIRKRKFVYECSNCKRIVLIEGVNRDCDLKSEYNILLSMYPYCHCGSQMGLDEINEKENNK